jgi:outer membrane protein assembly factor BamA
VTLAGRVRGGFVRTLGSTGRAVGAGGVSGGLGGTTVELLHPRTRFYAGGAQSVRGYGENQLGPRVLTIPPERILQWDSAGTRTVPLDGCATGELFVCLNNRQTVRNTRQSGRDTTQLAYPIDDNDFTPRPLGGTALVEANIEARFPVWRQLFGAVFVDMGMLGEGSLRDVSSGTRAITPGFGVRYRSPVGPVRVDLGIRPTLQETLPVITQATGADGRNVLLDLTSGGDCAGGTGGAAVGCREYPQQNTTGIRGVVRRLVLHLSIGEAF